MASRRLTIYLLRGDVYDFDDAVDPDKDAPSVEVSPTSNVEGRFIYLKPWAAEPSWVSFVQPLLDSPLPDIRSASASGLLLLRVSGRIFAVTFGYGRSLLDLSKIEFQFGLRVALNRVNPRQLRSLDTKTFEDLVVSTNTQVSKSAELPSFKVDVSTDLLRAATGEPNDKGLAKRLSGSDSLTLSVDLEPEDLPELCDELLQAFHDDEYKAEFAWIDQLTQVRQVSRIDDLNELLVQQLRTGVVGSTHLAMPESIDWQDIESFRIAGSGRVEFEDLDLEAYLGELRGGPSELTIELVKTRRVSVGFSRSGNFDARWSLFQCLVSEQRIDGALHVLIEGRWFAVSESLVEEVDNFLVQIPESDTILIPARHAETEGSYNTRLAGADPGGLLKFDGRILRAGGASSGIEFCDLLTLQGELIHVKRKSRSSTLSHLFSQGSVSAMTFLTDGAFREKLRAYIEKNVGQESSAAWLDLIPKLGESVEKSRYRITYAVVTNSRQGGRDWLPFFSKLNLMQQARQLLNTGYRVGLTRVPVASPREET